MAADYGSGFVLRGSAGRSRTVPSASRADHAGAQAEVSPSRLRLGTVLLVATLVSMLMWVGLIAGVLALLG